MGFAWGFKSWKGWFRVAGFVVLRVFRVFRVLVAWGEGGGTDTRHGTIHTSHTHTWNTCVCIYIYMHIYIYVCIPEYTKYIYIYIHNHTCIAQWAQLRRARFAQRALPARRSPPWTRSRPSSTPPPLGHRPQDCHGSTALLLGYWVGLDMRILIRRLCEPGGLILASGSCAALRSARSRSPRKDELIQVPSIVYDTVRSLRQADDFS